MTMIIGKVVTIITGALSASTVNICFEKLAEMSKLAEVFPRLVCEDVCKYGISSLQMWIGCKESIIHISYNLDFIMWSEGETKNCNNSNNQ